VAVGGSIRIQFLSPSGTVVSARVLIGPHGPDLDLVQALARWQLVARRAGGAVVLVDPAPELLDLLELVGLRREVGGQAEAGEEGFGLQEGVEGDDLVP
jgi:hypothetical protein